MVVKTHVRRHNHDLAIGEECLRGKEHFFVNPKAFQLKRKMECTNLKIIEKSSSTVRTNEIFVSSRLELTHDGGKCLNRNLIIQRVFSFSRGPVFIAFIDFSASFFLLNSSLAMCFAELRQKSWIRHCTKTKKNVCFTSGLSIWAIYQTAFCNFYHLFSMQGGNKFLSFPSFFWLSSFRLPPNLIRLALTNIGLLRETNDFSSLSSAYHHLYTVPLLIFVDITFDVRDFLFFIWSRSTRFVRVSKSPVRIRCKCRQCWTLLNLQKFWSRDLLSFSFYFALSKLRTLFQKIFEDILGNVNI